MKTSSLFIAILMVLANAGHANTTIDTVNKYAWGANLGWLDWSGGSGETANGVVVSSNVCSGYIYSADVGWISLGSGSPANGSYYQNNSASDFGVNMDGLGNLRGYAYGANIGWINFETNGAPSVNLLTGQFSGYVWSANCGWISLSNAVAYVQTDTILPSSAAPLKFTGIGVSGTTLTIKAVNGAPSGQYMLLTSTNLTLPISQWKSLMTNYFDSGGNLNLSTNLINPSVRQQFFILKQ